MRSLFAVLFVMTFCASELSAISTQGFRPGKKHSALSSHHHVSVSHTEKHHKLHDLEKDLEKSASASSPSAQEMVEKMDEGFSTVMSDMDSLNRDLKSMKELEQQMRDFLAGNNGGNVKAAKVDSSAEEQVDGDVPQLQQEEEPAQTVVDDDSNANNDVPASDNSSLEETQDKDSSAADSFADDADSVSLLELKNVNDDMNNPMDDDDGAVPTLLMNRMRSHSLLQARTKKPGDEEGRTFGISADGSGRTFDIAADGSTLVHDAPDIPKGMVTPNDAKYRVDPNDPSLAGVGVADVDPSEVRVDANIPGTSGKQWSVMAGSNSTTEKDMVCVCKRHGAPRGEDRVRCKRHPTPTPTPTPPPPKEEGSIIQCTNGTWPKGAVEAGSRDIICVYFPVRAPVPTPTPIPSPSVPEYPPECYDPRNEYVAEGVTIQKLPYDSLLIQQGFEVCGC